jgi:hypothetical protein
MRKTSPKKPTTAVVKEPSDGPVQRAEQVVDAWAQRLSGLLDSGLRVGSRLREELEDLWAEAKAVSRS